jgi:flagellar motility protein MotE (MotC chaperone)
MIHSESFAALSQVARKQVLKRIVEIAEGKDSAARFASITASERAEILELLREFKLAP